MYIDRYKLLEQTILDSFRCAKTTGLQWQTCFFPPAPENFTRSLVNKNFVPVDNERIIKLRI